MTGFLRFLFLISCSLTIVLSQSFGELTLLEFSISEDHCDFYRILESITSCGDDGYVEDFGLKYCQAYLDHRESFHDQTWQNGVRTCLQRTMLSKLQSSPGASCSQIKTWGFDSHLGCYMHPIPSSPEVKFCHLKSADIARIAWIAKGAIFETEVWAQFGRMTKECAGKYLQDVNEDFVNFLKKTMDKVGWTH